MNCFGCNFCDGRDVYLHICDTIRNDLLTNREKNHKKDGQKSARMYERMGMDSR